MPSTQVNGFVQRLRWTTALLVLCSAWLPAAHSASAPLDQPAESVTGLKSLLTAGPWDLHRIRPLAINGIVTFVAPTRGLVVLQDSDAAAAIHCATDLSHLRVGNRVHLTAAGVFPAIPSVPGFPFHPARTGIVESLQLGPTHQLDYVERLQAFVIPPVSGSYRFSISSDDTAELWLSPDEQSSHARRIAQVPSWTFEEEWNRYRGQTSDPIELTQGQPCYIEVLHEQGGGADHLEVAWQGPSGARELIKPEYLAPYPADENRENEHGVLQQFWVSSAAASPADLQPAASPLAEFQVDHPTIEVTGNGPLPFPVTLKAGQPIGVEGGFRWAQITAEVHSTRTSSNGLEIELAEGENRMTAHVQRWSTEAPADCRGYLVRLTGVCQPSFDAKGEIVPGVLWISDLDHVPIVGPSPTWDQLVPAHLKELANVNRRSDEDVPVRVKGRVLSQSSPRAFLLQEDSTFAAFRSDDGKTWRPLGDEISVPMRDPGFVGLAVTSHGEAPTVATFDHVAGLSSHATGHQIGSPRPDGGFSPHGDSITVTGSGRDIWDWEDGFYFVHDGLQGETEIVAHVAAVEMHSEWAKAGVMIRESLASDSAFVDLVNVGRKYVSLQWRVRNPHKTTEARYTPENDVSAWLKLVRHQRTIPVNLVRDANLSAGEPVEALGYLNKTSSGIEIIHGFARELEPTAPLPSADDDQPLVDVGALWTRNTTGLPNHFRMRGVVTYVNQSGSSPLFAIQDASGGSFIYDSNDGDRELVHVGMLVDVYCDPITADVSSGAVAGRVVVRGPAVFPNPTRHPAELMLPSKGEGQWVEVEGIVYAPAEGNAATVRAAGSTITIEAADMTRNDWASLVDRTIRVRGVATYRHTSELTVFVSGRANVETLGYDVVPASPPLRQLADFGAGQDISDPTHRTRIIGTVTFVHGQDAIIDDGSSAAPVQLRDRNDAIRPGDKAEVLGFPVVTPNGSLSLRYAEVRKVGTGSLPPPVRSTVAAVLEGRLGQRLATIEAELVAKGGTPAETLFEMQGDGRKFRVWCPARNDALDSIQPESRLRVTGFVSPESGNLSGTQVGGGSHDRAPLFIASSPEDIAVVQGPPWMRLRRALYVLGILAGFLAVVLVWVQILRRRVKQRTEQLAATMQQLRQETELAATLSERQRLAGEIHDSLEQGITGIMLQLEGALQSPNCPADVREIVTVARNMVSFSHAEIRHAILDLHSPVLEGQNLETVLRQLAQSAGSRTMAIEVAVHGTPANLPSELEHHLLRIAQEAVTNATKHANASRIDLELDYQPDAVELRIRDNGRGFSMESHLADNTHFGLRSLRRRARKMNATLSVKSLPGAGTVITVTVPRAREIIT